MGGPSTQLKDEQEQEREKAEGSEAPPSSSSNSLIMVSNRLPVSMERNVETGELSFKMSSGGKRIAAAFLWLNCPTCSNLCGWSPGLVSALVGVRDELKFLWVGWLGDEIEGKRIASAFLCLNRPTRGVSVRRK